MPKSKKPTIKVKDLRAKRNAKGGGKSGRADFSNLTIQKVLDKTSPLTASTTSTSSNLKISSTDALMNKIK